MAKRMPQSDAKASGEDFNEALVKKMPKQKGKLII